MSEIVGTAINPASGAPVNGATVDAWLDSRFSGVYPTQGSAPPGGSPDASVTSGVAYGGVGAFSLTVPDGKFWIRAVVGGGTADWRGPIETTADADVLHKGGSAETVTKVVTFTSNPVLNAGALPESAVANLTTDLTNRALDSAVVHNTGNETVAGIKTLTSQPVLTAGLQVTAGSIVLPNGSIAQAAVAGAGTPNAGLDIGSTQSATGQKSFLNDLPLIGGQLIGTALATASAPVLGGSGASGGSTTWAYEIVATAYDLRDGIPSPTGQTTTGLATLTVGNPINLTWSAVTNAASYKVLKFSGGAWKLLGTTSALTFTDDGSVTPSTYTAATVNPGGEAQITTLTLANALLGAAGAAMPRGVLGYNAGASNQNSIPGGAGSDVNTVTGTVGSGRRVRLSFYAAFFFNATQNLSCDFQESGTSLQHITFIQTTGNPFYVYTAVILQPSAGSHTYKMHCAASSGTVDLAASATNPQYLLAEDIGQ